MRLLTGGAPGMSAADMFTAIRDNPRLATPCIPSQEREFADLLAPMPPSKAHVRRLKRERPEIGKVSQKSWPAPLPDPILFLRGQLRQLGVPNVPPSPEPMDEECKARTKRIWRSVDNHKPWRAGEG